MFARPRAPWPESPPATDENRVLPIEGTDEGRYRAWRKTEDGARVYEWIALYALAKADAGAKRISINAAMEGARAALRLPCNNTHRSLISRDLVETYPRLRGPIELRERKAS